MMGVVSVEQGQLSGQTLVQANFTSLLGLAALVRMAVTPPDCLTIFINFKNIL
jgi:hypothetical protein